MSRDGLLLHLLGNLQNGRGEAAISFWRGRGKTGRERERGTHDSIEIANEHGLEELPSLLRVSDILESLSSVLSCERETKSKAV